jgi:steroid delta-isomerase-like uncharacterized protein
MSTKINKFVALRVIEELEGNNNLALIGDLFSPDYRFHLPGSAPLDQKGHERILSRLHNAFKEIQTTVLFQISEGDRVANHFILTGTHKGEFEGVAATGRSITVTGTNVMHFENGKVSEMWSYLDGVGTLQQLGVLPTNISKEPAESSVTPTPSEVSWMKSAEVVYRFIENFNNKETQLIGRDFSNNYKLDFPGGPTGFGPEGIRQAASDFITAFPDLWFKIDDLFSEEERVAWRWTMTGTHKGYLGVLPATGKMVTLSGISLFLIREGKIVEDTVRADMVGLLEQIGAIPARGENGNRTL